MANPVSVPRLRLESIGLSSHHSTRLDVFHKIPPLAAAPPSSSLHSNSSAPPRPSSSSTISSASSASYTVEPRVAARPRSTVATNEVRSHPAPAQADVPHEQRALPPPGRAEELPPDSREALAQARSQMHSLGARCAIDLGSAFSARAAAGKDFIDFPAAAHLLKSHRLRLTEAQYAALFAPYAEGGRLRVGPFIRDLIGSLSDRRRLPVQAVFDKMDTNHDGLLTANDIRRALRIAHHPLVVSGQATLDHVHTGFLSRAMDAKSEPVTCEQFLFYHAGLSTAFRRDEDFVAWLQRFWRP